MGQGIIAMIAGGIGKRKANKKLEKEIANAPKYQIQEEAYENKALAQSAAYGRDRSIQMQEENIDAGAAAAAMGARDVTSSTSALLSTLAQINANKNQQLRGLSQDEAALQNQKRTQLMGANASLIDEKDKAWNQNLNMPHQMRVAMYRDKVKFNEEAQLAGLSYEAQTSSAFLSSMGSMMGGACDERLKENIKPCEPGLDAVMEMRPVTFEYTHPRFKDDRTHVGFIAQEMKEVVPESVGIIHGLAAEGEDPFLKIDYNQLVPVLVNAIQDLKSQVDILTKKVKELEYESTAG